MEILFVEIFFNYALIFHYLLFTIALYCVYVLRIARSLSKFITHGILENVPFHGYDKLLYIVVKYFRKGQDANETRNDLSLARQKAARQVGREMVFLYY